MVVSATAATAYKTAFYEAAIALWAVDEPDVLVSFGHPGTTKVEDIVAVTRVTAEQDTATLGTNRSREETLTLIVQISCYQGGRGSDVEKACSDRAYKLLSDLGEYVRVTDTTLGGAVRDCFLTGHESDGETDSAFLATGRLIEIAATFTAHARITN